MTASSTEDRRLPRPFYAKTWPRNVRDAAHALWHWHGHLAGVSAQAIERDDLEAFFAEEVERARDGRPLRIIPEAVAEAAYAAVRRHGLRHDLLVRQVVAVQRLAGLLRFADTAALDAHVADWAMAHGRLLARLATLKGSWQLRYADELARAFFLTARLVALPQDLARDRLYLPMDELDRVGVTVDQLRRGVVDENVRKLLWKQAVRARDAFAQGQGLVKDLSGRYRRAFKKWWLGGLEVLNEVERRNYDVWTNPVRLSGLQRFRVRLQALAGRTTFR